MKRLLLILITMTSLFSQDYLEWRWSDQPINQMPDASALHAVGSGYMGHLFSYTMPWYDADLLSLSIGVLWEIKDGLLPWERIGVLGGEGFSTNDLIMDATGIAVNRLGSSIWNKYHFDSWYPGRRHFSAGVNLNSPYQFTMSWSF